MLFYNFYFNQSEIKVSLKTNQLTKIPQKIAEIIIKPIILSTLALKEMAISVPPIGVNNGGVSMAMPKSPSFVQIFTANLLLFVNIFLLVLGFLSRNFLMVFAKMVVETTAKTMPKAEKIIVCFNGTPVKNPAIGPPKNLIVLANITDMYFAISNLCSGF
jgi:hypothetical protein